MKNEKIKKIIEDNPSIQDLRKIAKLLNLRLKRTMKKREILKLIKKYLEENIGSSSYGKNEPNKNVCEEKIESSHAIKEIPKTYKKDAVILEYVSPYWVHLRWDFSDNTIDLLKSLDIQIFARVVDITNIIYNGSNGNKIFQSEIPVEAGKYYFNVENQNANYIGEIGYYMDETFSCLIKSNTIKTPSSSPRFSKSEKWILLKSHDWKKLDKETINSIEKNEEFNGSLTSEINLEYLNPSSSEHIKKLSKIKSGGKL